MVEFKSSKGFIMKDDVILSISDWFNTAKPNPTNQNIIQQIAYHCEEFAEMLDAIHCDFMSEQVKKLKLELLKVAESETESDNFMATTDKLALLDSLADQVVTSIGVATYAKMDIGGAINEVNRSNYSKFEVVDNSKFVPVINEQGKIVRGKNYFKPNLEPFLSK